MPRCTNDLAGVLLLLCGFSSAACGSDSPAAHGGTGGAAGAPATSGGAMASGGAIMMGGGATVTGANGGAGGVPAGSGGGVSQGGVMNGGAAGAINSGGTTGGGGTTPASGAGGIVVVGDGGAPSTDAGTGVTDDETLIPHPSWDCGMPDGIPPPTTGDLVFQADVQLGQIYDIGETQYGHRTLTEIKGGTVTGPKVKGTLMDRGLDYQLALSNGAVELEEINILQTSDGVPIYFRTCGTSTGPGVVRTVPDFEAPNASAYAFLNTAKLVGTRELDVVKKTLKFSVYQVTGPAPARTVKVEEPAGVPDQTWECKKASGTKGATVYMESVGIGAGSVAVGASKRGTRNIIPITGGTTTGKIAGTVLSGGADYQIIGTTFTLDARYTLHTSDGELIIVRNCGPVGGLVPVFEARTAGPYAWLNTNKWLSSDPGISPGAVNLTIYEQN